MPPKKNLRQKLQQLEQIEASDSDSSEGEEIILTAHTKPAKSDKADADKTTDAKTEQIDIADMLRAIELQQNTILAMRREMDYLKRKPKIPKKGDEEPVPSIKINPKNAKNTSELIKKLSEYKDTKLSVPVKNTKASAPAAAAPAPADRPKGILL